MIKVKSLFTVEPPLLYPETILLENAEGILQQDGTSLR